MEHKPTMVQVLMKQKSPDLSPIAGMMVKAIADDYRWGTMCNPVRYTFLSNVAGEVRSAADELKHVCMWDDGTIQVFEGECPAEFFPLVEAWTELRRPKNTLKITLSEKFAQWLHLRSSWQWRTGEKAGSLDPYEEPFYFGF